MKVGTLWTLEREDHPGFYRWVQSNHKDPSHRGGDGESE